MVLKISLNRPIQEGNIRFNNLLHLHILSIFQAILYTKSLTSLEPTLIKMMIWAFGRAFRYNLFAIEAKRIFTSIPNAKPDKCQKPFVFYLPIQTNVSATYYIFHNLISFNRKTRTYARVFKYHTCKY